MIKAIIFDLGGIIVPEKGNQIRKELCKYLNIKEKTFLHLFNPQIKILTTGKITLLNFYSYLKKRLKLPIKPRNILKEHLRLYKKYSTRKNKKVINLIKELKRKYNVVSLSNTEIEIKNYNRRNGLFKIFDKKFNSTDLHLMKPDQEIFFKVLKTLKYTPKEVIFIDDKKINIIQARKIGINSILFKNFYQLKNNLTIMLYKETS